MELAVTQDHDVVAAGNASVEVEVLVGRLGGLGRFHAGRNRLLARLRSRIPDFLNLLGASFLVEGKPIGNRMAMDSQLAAAALRLLAVPGFRRSIWKRRWI